MMRAVIAKLSGCRRRAAISSPGGAFFSMVSSTSQISSPRSRSRRIRPVVSDAAARHARGRNGPGASPRARSLRRSRARTVQPGHSGRAGVSGPAWAGRWPDPPRASFHARCPSTTVLPCVRSSRLAQSSMTPGAMMSQDSLVLFLADLTQAAVAGQDLGPGHQWRPWRRRRGGRRLPREQTRRHPGEQAAKRPCWRPRHPHPLPQDEARYGLAGERAMAKIDASGSPRAMEIWLLPFAAMFTQPSWLNAVALATGALLCLNRRTVCAALRAVDGTSDKGFSRFHRFLSRGEWSGLPGARILLGLLQKAFVPEGEPLVIAVDDSVERRRGSKIRDKGIWRDPVRSSRGFFVKVAGLRWLSLQVVARPGFASAHLGVAVPDGPEPFGAGRCQAAAATSDAAGEGHLGHAAGCPLVSGPTAGDGGGRRLRQPGCFSGRCVSRACAWRAAGWTRASSTHRRRAREAREAGRVWSAPAS